MELWVLAAAIVLAGATVAGAVFLRLRRGPSEEELETQRIQEMRADEVEQGVAGIMRSQSDIAGRLSQLKEESTSNHIGLVRTLEDRLEGVKMNLGQGLTETTDKTNQSIAQVQDRLASINDIAGKISELGDASKSSLYAGLWGETQMADIVRMAQPPSAYTLNIVMPNGRKADCVITLPSPPGPIVIDSKMPLDTFHALAKASGEDEVKQAERNVRNAVLKHVVDIAERYIVSGETAESAMMFIPSEGIYAELHRRFPDVIEKSFRARVWIVSPTNLMATLNTVRGIMKDAQMRDQAHVIQKEVGLMMDDVGRMQTRVLNLQAHFGQSEKDVREILISADKIARRAERIEDVQLGEIDPKLAAAQLAAQEQKALSDQSGKQVVQPATSELPLPLAEPPKAFAIKGSDSDGPASPAEEQQAKSLVTPGAFPATGGYPSTRPLTDEFLGVPNPTAPVKKTDVKKAAGTAPRMPAPMMSADALTVEDAPATEADLSPVSKTPVAVKKAEPKDEASVWASLWLSAMNAGQGSTPAVKKPAPALEAPKPTPIATAAPKTAVKDDDDDIPSPEAVWANLWLSAMSGEDDAAAARKASIPSVKPPMPAVSKTPSIPVPAPVKSQASKPSPLAATSMAGKIPAAFATKAAKASLGSELDDTPAEVSKAPKTTGVTADPRADETQFAMAPAQPFNALAEAVGQLAAATEAFDRPEPVKNTPAPAKPVSDSRMKSGYEAAMRLYEPFAIATPKAAELTAQKLAEAKRKNTVPTPPRREDAKASVKPAGIPAVPTAAAFAAPSFADMAEELAEFGVPLAPLTIDQPTAKSASKPVSPSVDAAKASSIEVKRSEPKAPAGKASSVFGQGVYYPGILGEPSQPAHAPTASAATMKPLASAAKPATKEPTGYEPKVTAGDSSVPEDPDFDIEFDDRPTIWPLV